MLLISILIQWLYKEIELHCQNIPFHVDTCTLDVWKFTVSESLLYVVYIPIPRHFDCSDKYFGVLYPQRKFTTILTLSSFTFFKISYVSLFAGRLQMSHILTRF